MTLSQTKTWKFQVNQIYPSTGNAVTTSRELIYAIKSKFFMSEGSWTDIDGLATTAPTAGWTVESSFAGNFGDFSNNDQVDRWTSASALGTGGGFNVSPWIHFNNVAGDPTKQYVFNWGGGNNQQVMGIKSSALGFGAANGGVDGGNGITPTNTDQDILIATDVIVGAEPSAYFGVESTPKQTVLHFMKTDDGYSARCILTKEGKVTGYFAIEKSENVSGASPTIITLAGNTTANDIITYSNLSSNSKYYIRTPLDYLVSEINLSGEGKLGGGLLAEDLGNINEISASYAVYPVGLYSSTTGTGKYGNFADLWWASANVPSGSTYPSDGSKQFVQMGNLIFPWNKSTPIMF